MRRRVLALAPLLAATALVACATRLAPDEGREPPSRALAPSLPVPSGQARPERLLLVSVHGLPPAAYLDADAPVAMPTLTALGSAGVAAEALTPVFPPAVYPTHTTLVTGRLPAHHGVAADRLLGERGVRAERYAHASHVRTTTLWQAATEAERSTAALDWPATGGASISGLLPDVRPRRRGKSWSGLLEDSATPLLFDLALQAGADAPAAGRPGPERDSVLCGVACALYASESPPGLLLLRLSQTEAALRVFGPGAPQLHEAFARADAELARLVGCLEKAGLLSTTAIVVVGDHGTLPVHTALRPNAFLADAGLIVTAGGGTANSWSAIARSNGGSAFVYARNEDDALLARRALEEAAQQTRTFRVLSAEEMLRLGADPEAWFGLEAEPGYLFENGFGPAPVAAAVTRASGGYLPARPAMTTGLVAWGAGIRRGVRAPVLAQVDVAPTLARLLGLELGAVDGRVVVGLLNTRGVGDALRRRREGAGGS